MDIDLTRTRGWLNLRDGPEFWDHVRDVRGPSGGEIAMVTLYTFIDSQRAKFYWLSRAISTGCVDGSLTRQFALSSDVRRTYVHGLPEYLPDTVEMLGGIHRCPMPPIGAMAALTSVNFLMAEAMPSRCGAPRLLRTRGRRSDIGGGDGSGSGHGRVECFVLPRA